MFHAFAHLFSLIYQFMCELHNLYRAIATKGEKEVVRYLDECTLGELPSWLLFKASTRTKVGA